MLMTSQDQPVVQPLKKQVWTVGSCVKQQVDQPFLKVLNRPLQCCNEIIGFKHETAVHHQITNHSICAIKILVEWSDLY